MSLALIWMLEFLHQEMIWGWFTILCVKVICKVLINHARLCLEFLIIVSFCLRWLRSFLYIMKIWITCLLRFNYFITWAIADWKCMMIWKEHGEMVIDVHFFLNSRKVRERNRIILMGKHSRQIVQLKLATIIGRKENFRHTLSFTIEDFNWCGQFGC